MSFSPGTSQAAGRSDAAVTTHSDDSSATAGTVEQGASTSVLSRVTSSITTSREGAFAGLGPTFMTRLPAAPLPEPYVVGFSAETARLLGFDPAVVKDPGFAAWFSGNTTRDWSDHAMPYASVYSGHQFGVWAGQLGDGRAIGLGEVEHAGRRYELQLKGSGRTPYSRLGDGRAVLRSSIREFLCSEAMHHLGIPTTRALCVTGSDQPVRREEIETAAVVTRVSPSFVRFGHFEHFYANDRVDALRTLADHVIERFYPHCREADDPYLALLAEAVQSTAGLVAQWQAVGFCHGVMNTDNMSILGLTIDYGPFGFMDGFDAGHICNHSDSQGRYAYRMQPQIAYWNLFCLAQALLPVIGERHEEAKRGERAVEDAQRVLEGFKERFAPSLEQRLRDKLGLETARDGDDALANRLLEIMHANRADFTLTFRHLARVSKHRKDDVSADAPVRDLFLDRAAFDAWAADYRTRLAAEARDDASRAAAMNRVNPKFVLRNHLAETAIRRAKEKDFSEVERLAAVLQHPFDEQPEYERYAALPPDWAGSLEVSCSS
ncbi:protein adenylyltransferase SelO [Paraburkholderia sp. SUR17]|uniref:protein adenylyltransferase SelO n=1 Tax=Paraburkholderia sp. SUR17 TaxID=3034358 RepID=UPI002407A4E1|nr:YdiU family protein [Paraburkholderia sp. SUR17]WEY40377.1 YdiU family protein [Paraburkholderia sp. SUR17]